MPKVTLTRKPLLREASGLWLGYRVGAGVRRRAPQPPALGLESSWLPWFGFRRGARRLQCWRLTGAGGRGRTACVQRVRKWNWERVAQTEREFWREFACGQRWAPKPAPGSHYTLFITSQSRFPLKAVLWDHLLLASTSPTLDI